MRPRKPDARTSKRRPGVEALECRRLMATFVVSSTADAGPGTLRRAINDANLAAELDSILFNIPGVGQQVIRPNAPLPRIVTPIDISGYSQAGSRSNFDDATDDEEETNIAVLNVRIDGAQAGPGADGLVIDTSNASVSGLSITNFGGAGIVIDSADSAVGNRVSGNFIGIADFDETTNAALPGGGSPFANGVGVRVAGSNNRIGGTLPPSENVIQGNIGTGVVLEGPDGTGNLVEGNLILDNGDAGVLIRSSNNFIGEAIGVKAAGGGNVISGNQEGVLIVGPLARGNILVNNEIGTGLGIAGTDALIRGLVPRPNRAEGVRIEGAPDNFVGTSVGNGGNVIAANLGDGVRIVGQASSGNRLEQNFIGFNSRDVVSILPNRDGVRIESPRNLVGGTSEASRNTIHSNRDNGLTVLGPGALGNVVQGNFIGTFLGADDFGNSFDGVRIDGAPDVTVGGLAMGAGNVISGNNNGVVVQGAGAAGALIAGNLIGTTSDGNADLGNAVDGVAIRGAPDATIGGTSANARNVISGNDRGVRLDGAATTRALIAGNLIGLGIDGQSDVGNSIDGIITSGGASGNTIGGLGPNAGNRIMFNVQAGVRIESGDRNSILSNAIDRNTMLGIDEAEIGVSPIGQGGIAAPVLTSAISDGNAGSVQGTVAGTPGASILVQIFASPSADPSGFGEGATLIDTITLVIGPDGTAEIDANFPVPVARGAFVTATATDASGNTSEFSNAVPTEPILLQFGAAEFRGSEAGGSIDVLVTRGGAIGGRATVTLASMGGSAVPGADYTPINTSITFEPGQENLTVAIPVFDDSEITGPLTVGLTLADPSGGAVLGSPAAATLVIVDDDATVVRFDQPFIVVDEGAGTAVFTVVRSDGTGQALVSFATMDGSAVAGLDYTASSGVLTFEDGVTEARIVVPLIDDNNREPTETFAVFLSDPVGLTLGDPSGAGAELRDDDGPGAVGFPGPTLLVGEGFGVAEITVVRPDSESGRSATVLLSTSDGTALAGLDYLPVSTAVTFAPGETSKTVSIPILDDRVTEALETFGVVLSDPEGGATLATLTVSILDDDVDRLGPTVSNVELVRGPFGINAVVLSFNEALEPTSASNLSNYGNRIITAGRDGRLGTRDDGAIPLLAALYDPSTFQVRLIPAAPLPFDQFFRVAADAPTVNGPVPGIYDRFGNRLDGNGDGIPDATFVVDAFVGRTVTYNEADGDLVSIRIAHGGLLEFQRTPNGPVRSLRLTETLPGRSLLLGSFRPTRRGTDRRAFLPPILGAQGVQLRLPRPPFVIGPG